MAGSFLVLLLPLFSFANGARVVDSDKHMANVGEHVPPGSLANISSPYAPQLSPRMGGGHAYVTFVEGFDHFKLAAVMAKSMQTLRHKYPLVFMVREDSALVPKIPEIQEAMRQHSWNVIFQRFDPVDIRPEVKGLPSWKEAWQKMAVYNLDPTEYDRFAYLDADMLVLKNLDEIMDKMSAPTFARRMGACSRVEDIHTPVPITNFFSGQPDTATYKKIAAFLKGHESDAIITDEGAVFPGFFPNHELLQPEDLFYYDCFKNLAKTDDQLRAYKSSLPDGIRVLHLGVPGRADAKRALSEQGVMDLATEVEAGGQFFRAQAMRRWHELYWSKDVQDVLIAGKAAS